MCPTLPTVVKKFFFIYDNFPASYFNVHTNENEIGVLYQLSDISGSFKDICSHAKKNPITHYGIPRF